MDNKKYIAKKVLKFMIKWLKPKAITAIACCVVIIFFASIVYYLNIVDGENRDKDMTSTPYAVTNYTKSAKITSEGIDITKSPQELWNEMIEAGNNVKEYLKSPEELEKLMNAEIVTQYPKIGKGNLDGIIQFERNKSDGKTSTLTYIDSATFSNYINNNDASAINYFTLDESGNVLIATVDTTTEELTKNEDDFNIGQYTSTLSEDNKSGENAYKKTETKVISKPIDYKAYVQKYTMPFDFLWALLVIGEDKDFVLELADLVQSSQITISIYDNITTTVNKDTFTYNKEIRTDTYAKVKSSEDYGVDDYPSERYWADENAENYDPSRYSATYSTDDTEYNIIHTTTTQTNTPIVDLTKADVWITNFSKEYEYQASKTESQEEDEVDLEETAFIESKDSPEDSDTNPELLNNEKAISLAEEAKKYIEGKIGHNANEIQDEANGISVDVTYVKNNYYERNIKGKQKHDSSTSLQKYISGTSTIVDKTEKNSEEKNFVTLLCSHKDAKSNILEVSSWLFEILESNDDTKNMVDLTKYLLYKASGIDYGKTEYDFSEYESSSFSGMNGVSGGNIQEKVWFALKELGYSDIVVAGAMGNIHYESGGFSASSVEGGSGEGIGLIQWSFGRKTQLINYATSKGLTWQDEDTQVEFLIAEISGQGPASGYAGVRISGYIKEESIVSTSSDWANATNINDATLYFMRFFESPKSTKSLTDRQSLAQGYYEQYQGKTAPAKVETKLTGENKTKMENLISEAIRIANDDKYQYSQPFRESEYYYDCSSYVSRLYTQCFGISRLDSGTAGRGTDNIKANCKSKYNVVSMTDLQPGDILWTDGHVALYIGNNQIAEAQGDDTGILIGTYKQNRFTEAYRVIQ